MSAQCQFETAETALVVTSWSRDLSLALEFLEMTGATSTTFAAVTYSTAWNYSTRSHRVAGRWIRHWSLAFRWNSVKTYTLTSESRGQLSESCVAGDGALWASVQETLTSSRVAFPVLGAAGWGMDTVRVFRCLARRRILAMSRRGRQRLDGRRGWGSMRWARLTGVGRTGRRRRRLPGRRTGVGRRCRRATPWPYADVYPSYDGSGTTPARHDKTKYKYNLHIQSCI